MTSDPTETTVIYILPIYINLTKFEPLKPSHSGDIYQPFSFQNIYVWTKKYNVYSQNTHTSCIYFDIKFSGLSPIYSKCYYKIIKVVYNT